MRPSAIIRRAAPLAAMLASLGACGGGASDGGLSVDEERRLDAAAERLDSARPAPPPSQPAEAPPAEEPGTGR